MDSIFLREITLLCKEKNKDMKKIVGSFNCLEIYGLKCVREKRNLFLGRNLIACSKCFFLGFWMFVITYKKLQKAP